MTRVALLVDQTAENIGLHLGKAHGILDHIDICKRNMVRTIFGNLRIIPPE
jgi:hypothetical protein